MEYGRLVVLGYSSYRVASTSSSSSSSARLPKPTGDVDVARSPQGAIGPAPSKSEKDRRTIGQLWEPIGDQNAEYVLAKRKLGNGVQLSRFHHFLDTRLRGPSSEDVPKADLKTVTRRMLHAIEIRSKSLARSASASNVSSGSAASENDDDDFEVVSPSSSSSASSSSAARTRANLAPPPPPISSLVAPFLMCVPMNDTDAHASVTEYVSDATTDMFQIGRMPCRQNDVVIPGPRVGASGTISRFAARILCSREPPYECRIYAGGFDVGRKMTTAGHALKRCGGCGEWRKRVNADHKCVRDFMDDAVGELDGNNQREPHDDGHSRTRAEPRERNAADAAAASGMLDLDHVELEMNDPARVPVDGLTKNGVRVWLPEQKKWYEVSVNGNLYAIAPRTPSVSSLTGRNATVNPDTSVRHSAFNRPTGGVADVPALLTDGAIIDLGGVQLQFQASRRNQIIGDESNTVRASMVHVDDLSTHSTDGIDSSVASKMDKLNVHCPVQLHPLRFDRGSSEEEIDVDQVPHVFPACGHVFGFEKRIARAKMCPLCRTPGNFVRLLLKENFQLMSRAERTAVPECVFNPCGHAISNKLATHYSGLVMPNGRAICPFCAVHLDAKTPFSKLYLYSETETLAQHTYNTM